MAFRAYATLLGGALLFGVSAPTHAGNRAWFEIRRTSGEVSTSAPLPDGSRLRLRGAESGHALAVGGELWPGWGLEASAAGYGRYGEESKAQGHAVALLGEHALMRRLSWSLRLGVQRSVVSLASPDGEYRARQVEYGALAGLGLRWQPYDTVSLTLGVNEHDLSGGGLEFGVRAEIF